MNNITAIQIINVPRVYGANIKVKYALTQVNVLITKNGSRNF